MPKGGEKIEGAWLHIRISQHLRDAFYRAVKRRRRDENASAVVRQLVTRYVQDGASRDRKPK